MYVDTLKALAELARTKADFCRKSPAVYLLHSGLGGAYVGLAVIMIFALATPVVAAKLPFASLIMGLTFGLAQALVIYAGADLFSGNTLIVPVGVSMRSISMEDGVKIIGFSLVGNLIGSFLVATLAYQAGIFESDTSWVLAMAAKKMKATSKALLLRGMLCNWLLVLALWCSVRLKSEGSKLVMIWWCALAFIGSGYEHGVANMTLLTLANFLPHGADVSWKGWIHNLIPVLAGNFLSAALFVALPYLLAGKALEERGPQARTQNPQQFGDGFHTQMSRPLAQQPMAAPPPKMPQSGQSKIGNPRGGG